MSGGKFSSHSQLLKQPVVTLVFFLFFCFFFLMTESAARDNGM